MSSQLSTNMLQLYIVIVITITHYNSTVLFSFHDNNVYLYAQALHNTALYTVLWHHHVGYQQNKGTDHTAL